MGVGQDQPSGHSTLVEGPGVPELGQCLREVRHSGVEPRDGREVGADVEATQPMLNGGGRLGELSFGGPLFNLGRGDRVGGDDRGFNELGEARPWQPAIGGLRHSLIDVRCAVRGELAGLVSDIPRVGDLDLQRPHPPP